MTLNQTPYTLHLTPYTLHPTPYTRHPTPYTIRPTPYTIRITPYTLRPTPYTIRSTPYTTRPTPYIIHQVLAQVIHTFNARNPDELRLPARVCVCRCMYMHIRTHHMLLCVILQTSSCMQDGNSQSVRCTCTLAYVYEFARAHAHSSLEKDSARRLNIPIAAALRQTSSVLTHAISTYLLHTYT